MCKSILKYIHCHPIWRLLSTIQQRQHSGHRPSVQSLSTLSADCSTRLATHQSAGKMTWSEVGEQVAAAKWICIASTKECLQTVNRPNTVLEMIPGTEVTLLSESEVDFAFDDGQFGVQKKFFFTGGFLTLSQIPHIFMVKILQCAINAGLVLWQSEGGKGKRTSGGAERNFP